MGENADNVLTSMRITSEDHKKYDTVLAKFDELFKVKRNVIFEEPNLIIKASYFIRLWSSTSPSSIL